MNLKEGVKNLESLPIDTALNVEAAVYEKETKRTETAANFARTLQPLQLPMYRRGLALRSRQGPVVFGEGKIGFFITTTSMLAHCNVLATYTKRATKYRPHVYIVADKPGDLVKLREAYGCPVHFIDYAPGCFNKLREQLLKDQIDMLWIVSCPVWGAFLSGMRPTSKLGWWSYKYHDLRIPGLDAYVSTHLNDECKWKHSNGKTWFNTPGAYDYLYDPEAEEQGKIIRSIAPFRDSVVLGVMGRDEKLDNPEYAACISRILDANPQTHFIFTGKRGIPSALRSLPEGRSTWVGWVNTKVWAHVIDIYCDSFSLPSGQTFCEAALAGKPIVSLVGSPESKQASILANIDPAKHHELGVRYTPQTYYELVDDLIGSIEIRRAYGKSIKDWVLTNKMNTGKFVESFERVVEEVIDA